MVYTFRQTVTGLCCFPDINPYPAEPRYTLPLQTVSEEANWSGSALFAVKYVNFYQQSGSSDLIGWKLKVGVAS